MPPDGTSVTGLQRLQSTENRQKLSALYDAYNDLSGLVKLALPESSNSLRWPSENEKLNFMYMQLVDVVKNLVSELQIQPESSRRQKLGHFYIPFTNLLNAESTMRNSNPPLMLVDVHSGMSETSSDLKDLLEEVKAATAPPPIDVEALLKEIRDEIQHVSSRPVSEQKSIGTVSEPVSLRTQDIQFDDEQPAILVGSERFALTRLNKDYCFVRAMFDYQPSEEVDWNIVLAAMNTYLGIGSLYAASVSDDRKHESLRKLANRVSKRIQKRLETEDSLFTARAGSFVRNYGT